MKTQLLALYMSPFFPVLFALVVWPALTGALSLFHGKIEPKYPRFVAFLRASGLSLPGVWSVLRSFFPKVPGLPAGLSVLSALFAALVLFGCGGCGASGISPQTGIVIGEDLGQVTCNILEGIPQTDTTLTQLVCSQLPKPGVKGTLKTFRLTVDKATAAMLTAPPAGKVSP